MASVIIAGCGYVGIALGLRLVAAGHRVHGVRRSAEALPPDILPFVADLTDAATLVNLPEADCIVYAAGAVSRTETAYRDAYVTGLQNILAVARTWKQSPQVIFTSSTGVYHQTQGEWVAESSPALPQNFSGRILLEGEALLRASGVPHTVVRFAGIYGPGRTGLIDSVRNGTARCRADTQFLNHLHRDDCAAILHHLLDSPQSESLYLGVDDCPVARSMVLHWIAEQLRLPPPPADAEALPPARGGNRRYSNALLKSTGYTFQYPTFVEGYRGLLSPGAG